MRFNAYMKKNQMYTVQGLHVLCNLWIEPMSGLVKKSVSNEALYIAFNIWANHWMLLLPLIKIYLQKCILIMSTELLSHEVYYAVMECINEI